MYETTKIERADIRATDAVAPASSTVPVGVLGWLSEVADQPQLISLCTAAAAFGLVTANRRLATTGVRALAAELVATAIKSFVKRRVDRTRPYVPGDGGDYRMQKGDGDHDSALNSFPSGHTAGAVAVALSVARGYPEHTMAAYATAGAIAVVQVPRLKHYPTDLAAGALVGLAAYGAVSLAEIVITNAASVQCADRR